MPALFNYLVLLMLVIYALLLVVDALSPARRAALRFEIPLLMVLVAVLYLTTGFPVPSGRIAFGGISPFAMIGLMYACVVLGMVARYVFFLRGRPDWLAMAKPLCVSPLILLPLIGSVQGATSIQALQAVSLGILGFQNGFFWNIVLDRTQRQLRGASR